MVPSPDELAGTVDRFGGLTRAELERALTDLAARAGRAIDRDAIGKAVDDALESYYLLEIEQPSTEGVTDPLLIAGPAALPALPEGGEDLPHLLDIEPRPIDRAAAARAVEERLRRDVAAAVSADDADRAERLLDACYAVESWGPVDLADAKAGLSALLE